MNVDLNTNLILAALAAALILGFISLVLGFVLRRRPGKLNQEQFIRRWQDLQVNCKTENTWPLAVIEADKLLDEALRKLHYKGKTMGERMVSAQRDISDNDAVWYGHKLRNKIVHEQISLKQRDVQNALQGFRQALRDLRAL